MIFFLLCWWAVGIVLIQFDLYITKDGYFSEEKSWKLANLVEEIFAGLLGPVAIFPILVEGPLGKIELKKPKGKKE